MYVLHRSCSQAIEFQHTKVVFREVWRLGPRLGRGEVLRTLSRFSAVEDRERRTLQFDVPGNENPFVVVVYV